MKTLITIFCILLFVGQNKIVAQNQGEPAPDFTLTRLAGGNFNLSYNTGKVVFIFWLGYNCPFCISAAPSISSEIIATYDSNPDFVAIGIDVWDGSSSGVQNFKNQTGLDIDYLLMGRSVADSYSTTYDRLSVVDRNGILKYKSIQNASSSINSAKVAIEEAIQEVTTDIEDLEAFTRDFVVYPNPVTENGTIHFRLDDHSMVEMEVYDLHGRLIRTLTSQIYEPGEHELAINGDGFASGIYIVQLKNNGILLSRKLVVE